MLPFKRTDNNDKSTRVRACSVCRVGRQHLIARWSNNSQINMHEPHLQGHFRKLKFIEILEWYRIIVAGGNHCQYLLTVDLAEAYRSRCPFICLLQTHTHTHKHTDTHERCITGRTTWKPFFQSDPIECVSMPTISLCCYRKLIAGSMETDDTKYAIPKCHNLLKLFSTSPRR